MAQGSLTWNKWRATLLLWRTHEKKSFRGLRRCRCLRRRRRRGEKMRGEKRRRRIAARGRPRIESSRVEWLLWLISLRFFYFLLDSQSLLSSTIVVTIVERDAIPSHPILASDRSSSSSSYYYFYYNVLSFWKLPSLSPFHFLRPSWWCDDDGGQQPKGKDRPTDRPTDRSTDQRERRKLTKERRNVFPIVAISSTPRRVEDKLLGACMDRARRVSTELWAVYSL